jgi:hypothetical protein
MDLEHCALWIRADCYSVEDRPIDVELAILSAIEDLGVLVRGLPILLGPE